MMDTWDFILLFSLLLECLKIFIIKKLGATAPKGGNMVKNWEHLAPRVSDKELGRCSSS